MVKSDEKSKVAAIFSENPILVVGQNADLTCRKVVTLEESTTVKIHTFLIPFDDVGHDSTPHPIPHPT